MAYDECMGFTAAAVCVFALASVLPAQQRPEPTPRRGDVSLAKARAIAQAFADKAGFRVKVASLPVQYFEGPIASDKNGYRVRDKRAWFIGSPEISFSVGAITGRLMECRRTNRADTAHRNPKVGAHAATRRAIASHAVRMAAKLGLFKPVRVEPFGTFHDDGRPMGSPPDSVRLYGDRREVHLWFHKQDGDLVLYIDQPAVPSVGPRGVVRANQAEVGGSTAKSRVASFASLLKLDPIRPDDSMATLYRADSGRRLWRVDHPNSRADVDAKTGRVMRLVNIVKGRVFIPKDTPIVRTAAEAKKLLDPIAHRAGVPKTAIGRFTIINELVDHVGWVGLINGDYGWGRETCEIRCDLRKGELFVVNFLRQPDRGRIPGDPPSPHLHTGPRPPVRTKKKGG